MNNLWKKCNPKKLKNKFFFWLPDLLEEQKSCCFNSKLHNRLSIWHKICCDMNLVHFYILLKNGTTIKQKLHSQLHDWILKFTSRIPLRSLGVKNLYCIIRWLRGHLLHCILESRMCISFPNIIGLTVNVVIFIPCWKLKDCYNWKIS